MLSEAFLSRLDALALRLRHAAAGGSGGQRKSRALGSSVEFSDFREYTPGDDIRRVDWNAYARFDRLFLKLFMEEQEQRVHLIVDASASMEGEKWNAASKLMLSLCYVSLCGGDSVTLYALEGEMIRHTRALRGRQSYTQALAFLAGIQPSGQTSVETAIPALPMAQGAGTAILVTDMLFEDGYQKALSSLRYRRQETHVLQVWSNEEWEPQYEGELELVDGETGERLVFQSSYDALKAYQEAARAYVDKLVKDCHSQGITHALILPENDFEAQMLRELTRLGLIA